MSYSFRFPFSIFMYQAPLKPSGQPRWYEVLRADDRNWAEYVAGLLHNAGTPASPETKPVLKVVRYGNTLLALPDEATVVVKSVNVEHFSARRLSSTAIDHLKRRSRGGWSHIVFINSGVQSYRFYSLCPTPPTSKHGKKRATVWLGYKVHFTQTCDEDAPQLITHVETTPAPRSSEGVLAAIHADLAEKELLPDQHLVDSGYVTVANLVQSQFDSGVDLVGPTLKTHWYQAETGYDLTHFSIDWDAESMICPQGRVSSSWIPVQDGGKSLIKVKFSQSDCKVCPARVCCTGTTRRSLTLHPKEQMQALFTARQRESTEAFKETYHHRAGIEGTHSQGVRTMGLRRSRYIGLRKTHLGHVAVAAAINVIQLMSWLRGEAPEQTRTSAFKQVMKQAA